MNHYLEEIRLYEDELEPVELILSEIRAVIFSYFKIKKSKKLTTTDEQLRKLSSRKKMSKNGFSGLMSLRPGEIKAYADAGMPSPFRRWLRKYRKNKNG